MADDIHNDDPASESGPGGSRGAPAAGARDRVWGGVDRLGYRRRMSRLGARRPRAARDSGKGSGPSTGDDRVRGARLSGAGLSDAGRSGDPYDALSPRVWEAVLWALAFSGMGQMYNGRPKRGVASVLLPAGLLVTAAWTHSTVFYLMAFWAGACTAPTVLLLFAGLVGWVPMSHPAIWMGLPVKAALVLEAGYGAYRMRRAGEVARRPRFARSAYLGALSVLLLVWIFSLGLVSVRQPDMSPVVEPGDHLVVDRLAFGLQIPLIGVRIGGRAIRRGERVVVLDPKGSGRLLVRRVFGKAGDRIVFGLAAGPGGVQQPLLGRAGAQPTPVLWLPWPGPCVYALSPQRRRPRHNYVRCLSFVEVLDKARYRVSYRRVLQSASPGGQSNSESVTQSGSSSQSGSAKGKSWEGTVPRGHLFLMADNRTGVDSRRWGPVSERRIRGQPLAVIWSSDPLEGVRWHRMGQKLVDWH